MLQTSVCRGSQVHAQTIKRQPEVCWTSPRVTSQIITNAPLLMVMVGPIIMMVAPLPLEMKIPASLTTIEAPVVLLNVTPPVGGVGGGMTGGGTTGGMSLTMIAFCRND